MTKRTSCIEVIKCSWNLSTENTTFDLLANISNLTTNLSKWKKDVFGKPNKKIKLLLKVIDKLKAKTPSNCITSLVNKKLLELEVLYDTQEEISKQQSSNNTIALGERNTTFFHVTTLKRRKRNNIDCIQDKNDNVISSRPEIAEVLTSHFADLFTENSTNSDDLIFSHINPCILIEENYDLTSIPSPEEIWDVVKNLKSNKAPGPDGFPVSFFKHNWGIVGPKLIVVIQEFFRNRKLHPELNKTFLFLIPKKKHPKNPADFRPIGLCNTPYKIIAKILANRLKKSLEKIFSPLQSAFFFL